MPCCAVKSCKNYDTKVTKKDGISYHRFPTDEKRKEIWSRIIREQRNDPYFKPRKNTRVCSDHFYDNDVDISNTGRRRLKESAIPRFETKICKIEEHRPSTAAENSQDEEINDDFSDLVSIFDTPMQLDLKKRIDRLEKQQSLAANKIQDLRKQNARLKKRNTSLQLIIKDLNRKNMQLQKLSPQMDQLPK